jgi:hypothetical protein
MNPEKQTLAKLLTYAGALPFLAVAAYALATGSPATAMEIGVAYGAVIVSFLSGIHWAVYLFFGARCPRNLLLTSNATALLAWLALLIAPSMHALLLLAPCLLYLLILDYKLRLREVIPAWFFVLRCRATAIVVLALALLGSAV